MAPVKAENVCNVNETPVSYCGRFSSTTTTTPAPPHLPYLCFNTYIACVMFVLFTRDTAVCDW